MKKNKNKQIYYKNKIQISKYKNFNNKNKLNI